MELFRPAQAVWLAAKRIVEGALGAERVDRWLDRLRFYELKSRLIRASATLPDGSRVTYRPIEKRAIEEVYGGCYRWARLEPGYAVVDVGANIGLFTLLAGRKIGAAGRLLCIEPEPENARLLRLNVAQNRLAQATVVEAAAAGRPGTLKLYRSGDPLMHSLKPRYSRFVEVAVDTLDALCEAHRFDAIDLVKIDVEGAELEVIAGGRRALARARQVILETHAPDEQKVRAELAGLGFRLEQREETPGGITLYALR